MTRDNNYIIKSLYDVAIIYALLTTADDDIRTYNGHWTGTYVKYIFIMSGGI